MNNNFDLTLGILREGKKKCCADSGTDKCKCTSGEPCCCTIEKDKSTGEYRVPAKNGNEKGACYEDDKEAAVGTCYAMYGDDCKIKFKLVPEFVGGKYDERKAKKKKPVSKKK
jgi:hypothetical protein